MKFIIAVFCLMAFAGISQSLSIRPVADDGRVHYDHYKVYRVEFTTEEQFKLLAEMRNNAIDLDFWQLSHAGHYADIMVGPKNIPKFLTMLNKYGFTYTIKIDDVEKILINKSARTVNDVDRKNYRGYKVYHVTFTTEEQFEFLRKMQIESGSGDFSFWQLCHVNKFADIMVSPTKITELLQILDEHNLTYEIMIDDVEDYLNNHK